MKVDRCEWWLAGFGLEKSGDSASLFQLLLGYRAPLVPVRRKTSIGALS